MPVELFSSPVRKLGQKLVDALTSKSDDCVISGRGLEGENRHRMMLRAGIYRDLAQMIREAADLDKSEEG